MAKAAWAKYKASQQAENPIAFSETHRQCRKCSSVKPNEEFRVHRRAGKLLRIRECRDCFNVRNREQKAKLLYERRDFVLARNQVWRHANRDKVREAQRRYKPAVEARKATCDRYRAKRSGAEGFYTDHDVKELVKQQGRCCYYCAQPLKLYHVDHFIPLSRGGTNWPDNIVIACEPCNYDKRAKFPWEWRPSQFSEGFLPR